MIDTSALPSYEALPSYRDVLPLWTPTTHLAYLDLVQLPFAKVDVYRPFLSFIHLLGCSDVLLYQDGSQGFGRQHGRVRERYTSLRSRLPVDGVQNRAV